MAKTVGGSFKRISPADITTSKSVLNQLVDVIQEDVSGSSTRRAYQVFVTGGIGPGVTSSLFQTVYDQDFTLQTANPIFDMTIGLFSGSDTVSDAKTRADETGKMLFPSQTLMMREKVDIYRQYAATLLGNANTAFYSPFAINSDAADVPLNRIDNAVFMSFKRLFSRDSIKRETFAVRMYRSGTAAMNTPFETGLTSDGTTNLNITSTSGSAIFTDIGANQNQESVHGGAVGNIKNAANTEESVGLIFYDAGTVILDAAKIFSGSQKMSGTIDAMSNESTPSSSGKTIMGDAHGNPDAKLIPDFFVSASIDDIVDHIASTRFQSGTLTAATFQNNTNINSTLVFCKASADEFNYSTNPTYKNADGRIRVIDDGQEDIQRSFTMPTTVGLHDEFGNLLAVAKMSRPIEKNDEKDITFRIRLDF